MRSTVRRVAALLILPALLLTGCGGSDAPEVVGGFGTKPQLTIPDAPPPTELRTTVITEGKGLPVKAGDRIYVRSALFNWRTRQPLDDNFNPESEVYSESLAKLNKGWNQGLVGKKAGSRVLLVVPPALGYGAAGKPPAIEPNDTVLYVVDILGSAPMDAKITGKMVPPGPGLPTVQGKPGVKPVIKLPAGAPPKQLVSKVLVEGTGPVLTAKSWTAVHYVGVTWPRGEEFDASWNRPESGPTGFPLDGVIKGWTEGLAGKKVGSRVLLVVPPAKGYGPGGNPAAGIKGTDTLVFVVDILTAS